MRIGVPREIKADEHRVAVTPGGVRELAHHGHDVLVESGAGVGSGFTDDEYRAAGADVLDDADDVWAGAGVVCKVKEPVDVEYDRLRPDLVLFTYLHLAASRPCTDALLAAGTTGIAYETVQLADGSLPLLAPMSEVAGRMAVQVGAHLLERYAGGRGVLLGGVPGVAAGQVAVIGGGVVGSCAVDMAVGLGAQVTVLDRDMARLRRLDEQWGGRIQTVASSIEGIELACRWADVVIGAVLVAGARAPKLVPDSLVAEMKPGSVLVDIAVDQGGCFESTRPTTHHEPTFVVEGSTFYCVANMPGAVPRTSTRALSNVTLPYLLALADEGPRAALTADPALAAGVNTVAGQITNAGVAEAHDLPLVPVSRVLASHW